MTQIVNNKTKGRFPFISQMLDDLEMCYRKYVRIGILVTIMRYG